MNQFFEEDSKAARRILCLIGIEAAILGAMVAFMLLAFAIVGSK